MFSSNITYVPGEVYVNIIKMLNYRGVKLDGAPLASDEVVKALNHFEYIKVTGTRKNDDPRGEAIVAVFLINPNSKYSNKTADFRKLVKWFPKRKNDEKMDIIFISKDPLTTHIVKQINVIRKENVNTQLEHYEYEKFLIEVPKHVAVPEHIILTEDEINEICEIEKCSRDQFPKILQTDSMAVWLGLKPGMVVKIKRISETACTAIAYRYCVRI
jgi:DNA-directed RNA polymerase subunit H (RpoH/RPB5)